MKPSLVLTAFALLCGSLIKAAEPVQDPSSNFLPTLTNGQRWQLTWHDEFNGAKIDTNKWEIMGDWRRRDDWWLKEDSFLDGKGNLVIRTKQTLLINEGAAERFRQLGSTSLVDRFRHGRSTALDGYSRRRLQHVWKVQHFSYWMTTMLHRFPEDRDGFQRQLQLGQLRYLVGSRAAQTSLAENYVGLIESGPA